MARKSMPRTDFERKPEFTRAVVCNDTGFKVEESEDFASCI
jgi:hypothetical protein